MNLKGKKILFISPEFFNVDKNIIDQLKFAGADVAWFDERSVKSAFGRALNSIFPYVFYFQANKYYEKNLNEHNADIDIILIIKGEMLSKKTLTNIRKKWPKAQLILYLYDPIVNIRGITSKLCLYDRVISFEPKDCKKYNMEFRPLFSDFNAVSANVKNYQYDICFYGTMYGDRFSVVNQVKEYCDKKNLRFYSFCFLRGKFMALYYWFTNKGFRQLGINNISFKAKKSSELHAIVQSSKIVLDANDVRQQGLTIRTLETLASGKKMITTNADIVNYDFYNPNNICVVNRERIEIPDSFFETKYEKVNDDVLKKYTAKGWIEDVFI